MDFDFENIFNDISIDVDSDKRIKNPIKIKPIKERFIKYENAVNLANKIDIGVNERVFCLVDGSFIFGDFIEAFVVEKNLHIENMTISTLSMSEANIDSLRNLIVGGFVESLSIIISSYFFSHERWGLIKYMYQQLDIDNKFQLSVCRTHVKAVCIKTTRGNKAVIHGSANLISSNSVEQINIEENKALYDYLIDFFNGIEKEHFTINKD